MGSSSSFCTLASMCPSASMLNACAICFVLTLACVALLTVCAAVGRARLVGEGFERGLDGDQRGHIVLVGRRDIAVRAAGRNHGLYGLEDLGHGRIVHRGVGGRQGE